ncbi:helix-turn-helix domain-containing protein [Xanthocytophaga flava]|uniref:helix-turn-helix domain-containing protein n=1 Tax=Xanthocytophaga flava TaxID=3048013 RepID=UPI0028D31D5E|nr:helix-turn-helix domain-containing protein [Xanthocytophaga flavus]MDJ1473608.1 helix-turn-helix domain-containing protein [Xanthocytophaga flavus]
MRKRYTPLTEPEVQTLQEGYRNHPSHSVRERCQCLLLSHQGKNVQELSKIFSVLPLTIYMWFNRWEEKGIVGILDQKGRGRKAILNQEDHALIKEKLQANAQKLSLVREELKVSLNKEFSEKTLKRFLKKLVNQSGDAQMVKMA